MNIVRFYQHAGKHTAVKSPRGFPLTGKAHRFRLVIESSMIVKTET